MKNLFPIFAGAIALAVALNPAPSGATPKSAPGSLCIHVYNHAGAPQNTLRWATAQAARVFTRAGIRTSWVQPAADLPEAHFFDLSGSNQLLATGQQSYLVVRLVKDLPANQYPNAVGFAIPFARIGVNVEIFYNRVKHQAIAGGVDADALLAYTLTHEIGHVLLRSLEHTIAGIMRARWDHDSIRRAGLERMAFLPEQARQMRETVERFNLQEQALAGIDLRGHN